MSDAAPAQVKTPKKRVSKPKTPAAHPKYSEMIAKAVTSLKERGGSSRQAILKYIIHNYKVGTNLTAVNAHLKSALKAGVKNGSLKQAKGTGAAGSFRLGEKKAAAAKKPKARGRPKSAGDKKPKAKKPKAKTEKKAAKPKKAKSPKKPKAAKATKPKATKPKAAKPKKPKSPKKVKSAKPKAAKKAKAAK